MHRSTCAGFRPWQWFFSLPLGAVLGVMAVLAFPMAGQAQPVRDDTSLVCAVIDVPPFGM